MSMIAVGRHVFDRHSISAVDASQGGAHELGIDQTRRSGA